MTGRMQNSITKKYILSIISAAFISFSFLAKFSEINPETKEGLTGAALVVDRLSKRILFTFEGKELAISLSIVIISFIFIKFYDKIMSLHHVKYEHIVAALLAVLFITGRFYWNEYFPCSSVFQIVKFAAGGVGFYLFYLLIIRVFFYLINRKSNKFNFKIINQHPFIFTFVFMMACWMPHLIIKYPAGIGWDASWQISQGLGDTVFTTHHPVFHTMLLTWSIRFGQLFGSANAGIFIYVLIQTIIGALIVSYIVCNLIRLSPAPWTIIFFLIFFAFNPYVTLYVGQTIKDVLYMHFYLLFVFMVVMYVWNEKKFWTWKKMILLIASAIMTGTVRNNGIYIVAITCIVLLIRELIVRKKKFYLHIIVFASCVIIPFAITSMFNYAYKAQKGSIAESLSIPIQQTARYAKYYDDATQQEKDYINAVLPYSEIGELYDPYISDPVKGRYNIEAGNEELENYISAWWSQGLRHPICYLEATLQQNILMFMPEYINEGYYVSVTDNDKAYEWKNEYFKSPNWLKNFLEPIYGSIMYTLNKFPLLYLFNNGAIYIIVEIILFLSFCTKKIKGRHILFIPQFISFLIIIAGPCSCLHVRYLFPIIYTVPLFLALYTSFYDKIAKT